MAIFKCKMCGGALEVQAGTKVCECEYCGTRQTIPSVDEDYFQNLFNRANNLRMKAEFDKAADLYEKIIQENQAEAEAYWGLVLCRYGVEYVEDPKTLKRIPTCHRTSYDAVVTDEDYLNTIKYSNPEQKNIYEAEAKTIDEIQKGILSVASSEAPYDVFICYKETDDQGKRTADSVTANDIYYQLEQEGFKVFYAAITLEDKLGNEYEPYIFAALNSAKVMLVIGSKPEYFNAAWVKNEWFRFMKLMRTDRSKTLIPCYKDMDAYELPEELAHLQAQDMSKIGFINDIIRGIRKLVDTSGKPLAEKPVKLTADTVNVDALLKRASLSLEDGEWKRADEFCEKVLDVDPENVQAYLGKLMAELQVTGQSKLADCVSPFDDRNNYKKVIRFCDDSLREELTQVNRAIRERNIAKRKNKLYEEADQKYRAAGTEKDFFDAAKLFDNLIPWRDSEERSREARKKAVEAAETARKDEIYHRANTQMVKSRDIASLTNSLGLFESISGWRDADVKTLNHKLLRR